MAVAAEQAVWNVQERWDNRDDFMARWESFGTRLTFRLPNGRYWSVGPQFRTYANWLYVFPDGSVCNRAYIADCVFGVQPPQEEGK